MSFHTPKQDLFENLVLGTLIYAVVLGFFSDYTDVLSTKSFSTVFALAIVMQVLTMLTLALKRTVAARIRSRGAQRQMLWLGLSIWLIMFLSKFVFLFVIEQIFSDSVAISGFVGLVLIIITMMVAQWIVDQIHDRLGSRDAGETA